MKHKTVYGAVYSALRGMDNATDDICNDVKITTYNTMRIGIDRVVGRDVGNVVDHAVRDVVYDAIRDTMSDIV